jgi:hypothetical protein
MTNGNTAPVCPVSRSQPTQAMQPFAPGVNSIPRAHNLITVITAINTMNHVVQQLTKGLPQINNIGTPPSPPQPPAPQFAPSNWQEIGRGYTEQEVVNPDDKSQSVTLHTLSFVVWEWPTTGHTLVYTK